ncbi:mitochondrial carrier [Epithele typhae]|uniref:mitochondrial carrier n=1 Tax=Epithele typhae TaxID=378194 RepID=UPI0020077CB9|nr:mitochondrial carrier [Epithele typhae]KAH9941230.1 mitochondrial carrier [Epithele typhae]
MEASPLPSPATEDSITIRAMKDIAFGSTAGICSKVFEHPFDLTKVRLQAQVLDATARFSGPLDCLAQTWRKEGVRGLYRGLPAPIVGAMAENATLFWTYTEIQNTLRWSLGTPDLSLRQLACAGAGAGAVTSFVLTPIELVKCKMQVQMLIAPTSSAPLPGPLAVLAGVVRDTGLRGLWLGHTGTLLRETGGGAAWFAAKEGVAGVLLRRRGLAPTARGELRAWESAAAGACAGVAYNVALFPADTVKSAMQTEAELRGPRAGGGRATFAGTARDMWRKGGLRGLYAGCGITVARAVPSSALIFIIYDGLSKRFS